MPQVINVGGKDITVIHRDNPKIAAAIPYFLTLGIESFAGTLYLQNPVDESFSDGAMAGVINATYHVDKNSVEVCQEGGAFKACVRFELGNNRVLARLCTWNIFQFKWDCGDWQILVSWSTGEAAP